jgi:hypothetical protein
LAGKRSKGVFKGKLVAFYNLRQKFLKPAFALGRLVGTFKARSAVLSAQPPPE